MITHIFHRDSQRIATTNAPNTTAIQRMQRPTFPTSITIAGVRHPLSSRDRSWVKDAASPCPTTGRPMCTIMEGHREVTSCSREFMEKFLENMLEWQLHLQILDPNRQHVKISSVDEIPDWLKLQDEEDERLREVHREFEELRKEQAARELEQALVDSRRLPSPEPSRESSPEPDYSLPDWHPPYPLAPGLPGRHFYYESDSDTDEVEIPVIRPLWANRHSDESTWRVVPERAAESLLVEEQASSPLGSNLDALSLSPPNTPSMTGQAPSSKSTASPKQSSLPSSPIKRPGSVGPADAPSFEDVPAPNPRAPSQSPSKSSSKSSPTRLPEQ